LCEEVDEEKCLEMGYNPSDLSCQTCEWVKNDAIKEECLGCCKNQVEVKKFAFASIEVDKR